MTPEGRLGPLRTPNFRRFFLGEVVNTAGSSMSGVALAFAVLEISGSATALGIVVAAWTVPAVALMLLGGAIADRLPRTLVLRGCNLVLGVVQSVAAVLVLTGRAEVWQLAVLEFVAGLMFAVSYPAFHGMVPILLPEPERKAAFLLLSQSESALRILGPAIAGVLVATVGAGWGLAADAASYLVAAGFLAFVRLPFGARPERRASVIGDFVAGWSFVRDLGWVIPVASFSLVFNALMSGALGVLGPTIASDTIGSTGWGLARSAEAVGIFVTAFALAKLTIRRPLRTCVIGFSGSALPMLVLGTRVSTPLLAAAFVVAGVGLAALGLAWNLVVQEKVREDMLSRVMSIDGFFSFVAMPIGQLVVGPLAAAFGAQRVVLAFGLVFLLVAAFGVTRPVITGVRLEGAGAAA